MNSPFVTKFPVLVLTMTVGFSLLPGLELTADSTEVNANNRPRDRESGSLDLGDENISDEKNIGEKKRTPHPPNEAENSLDAILRNMRAVQKRLEINDIGAETRKIQDSILKEIDKLIDLAKQSPPKQNSGKPQQKSPNENQPEKRKQKNADQPQTSESKSPETKGTNKDEEKSPESEEKTRAGEVKKAEIARQQQMLKNVWGHLPERLRKQLLNMHSEKYLPQYDDLVRRYFEALAEQSVRSK